MNRNSREKESRKENKGHSGDRRTKKNRGVGKKSRAGTRVRIWMLEQGIKAADIARDLGVDNSAITHFLNGNMTSRRITEYFQEKGCPQRLLTNLQKAA